MSENEKTHYQKAVTAIEWLRRECRREAESEWNNKLEGILEMLGESLLNIVDEKHDIQETLDAYEFVVVDLLENSEGAYERFHSVLEKAPYYKTVQDYKPAKKKKNG